MQFNDRIITLVYLWSVLHDRPVCWACDPRHWPPRSLAFQLPSDSTMSTRLRTVGVSALVERLTAAAADLFPVPLVKAIDSKPLPVGAYSKDADAKLGRVANGQFARGYRLHALTQSREMRAWTLGTMNEHDSKYAPALLARLDPGRGGYVAVDNAYDSNALYEAAAAVNHQLVAPPRAVNRDAPRDAKHNCPRRLRALDLLDSPLKACGQPSAFGRALYNCRESIESCFGELTMMGLGRLPAHVRGPRRVALWVGAKILACLVKHAKQKGLMA